MSITSSGFAAVQERGEELSLKGRFERPLDANTSPSTLSEKELLGLIRGAKSGSNSELAATLDLALSKFENLSSSERSQILKVGSDLINRCSTADLLTDSGGHLSPNATLADRQDAVVKALARGLVGIDSSEVTQVFSELYRLLNAETNANSPRELVKQRAKLAFDCLYEVGAGNIARVSQKSDVTCVLTVGNKDLARERPADYIKAIRQWTIEGAADISSSESSTIRISYFEGAVSEARLKGRTLGCAAYQNSVANHYGIIDTGMLPHAAERYYDDVHGGVKLLTPNTKVCSNTTSVEEIMKSAASSQWVGVSMKWSEQGKLHNNHFVRLKGDVEVDGKQYVRLENPWSSDDNIHLPAGVMASSKLIGGEGNEILMELSEFKERIYFALVKTNASDSGETAGLNKGNSTVTLFPELLVEDALLKLLETSKLKAPKLESEEERDAKARGATLRTNGPKKVSEPNESTNAKRGPK